MGGEGGGWVEGWRWAVRPPGFGFCNRFAGRSRRIRRGRRSRRRRLRGSREPRKEHRAPRTRGKENLPSDRKSKISRQAGNRNPLSDRKSYGRHVREYSRLRCAVRAAVAGMCACGRGWDAQVRGRSLRLTHCGARNGRCATHARACERWGPMPADA